MRVTNPQPLITPVAVLPSIYRNDCEQVPRLADELRMLWLGRVERVIEARPDQLVSVSYPPGSGAEIALVCFSSVAPP